MTPKRLQIDPGSSPGASLEPSKVLENFSRSFREHSFSQNHTSANLGKSSQAFRRTKFRKTLPSGNSPVASELIFGEFLSLRTLEFAIRSSVFGGFSIFDKIASKLLSRIQKGSKMSPKKLQNHPRSSPGAFPEPPEGLQEHSGSLREHSRCLQKLPEDPKFAEHEVF